MMTRQQQLESVIKAQGILGTVVGSSLIAWKASPSQEQALEIAEILEVKGSAAAQSRAAFIRRQLHGDAAEDFFDEHREVWGIPKFQEELITAADFRHGFMWRFRDHTTSWSENQYAQEWFLTSMEARTVTQYEFWECDTGPATCSETLEGNYKHILKSLLKEGVYEVLISSAFTSQELGRFIKKFSEEEGDFELEELIESYISLNPNFKPD